MIKHIFWLKKLPPFLYKIGAQAYIDYHFPRHLFIETTSRCNLSCWHCPRPKIENDMDMGMFQDIIIEASDYGKRSFSLHLFGEPLLDPFIIERMKYIKMVNPKNTIILTTNGTIHNREAYDLVDKIIITFRPQLDLTTREEWRHKIILRDFQNSYIPKGWRIERKDYHNYGGTIDSKLSGYITRYPCYHLWLAPAVAYNGDILLCCNSPYHDKSSLLGNIKNITIAEAWQSSYLAQLRDEHKRGIYTGICERCNCWRTYPNLF